jgi:hypothetical protein
VTRQVDHPDGFDPLADFIAEDILSASGDRMLDEAAEDFGDPAALAKEFDRLLLRGAAERRVAGIAAAVLVRTWKPLGACLRFLQRGLLLSADVFVSHRYALAGACAVLIAVLLPRHFSELPQSPGPAEYTALPPVLPLPPPPRPYRPLTAEQRWTEIQNTTDVATLEDFVRLYGDAPQYSSLARARLDALAAAPIPSARGSNILIVAEDADRDAIPRVDRNFDRILRAVTGELMSRGFNVREDIKVAMDMPAARGQLPEFLARLADPRSAGHQTGGPATGGHETEGQQTAGQPAGRQIDAVVLLQVHASVRPALAVQDSFTPSVRISGRVIRVRDGQDLGSYDFSPDIDFPIIQGSCANGALQHECLYETLGNEARQIGAAIGGTLATKLTDKLTAPNPNEPVRGSDILIVGEDTDMDAIPHFNPNFNRILLAVAGQLTSHGFKVHEELPIGRQPRRGRQNQLPELLEMARTAGSSIGGIVVFQIHVAIQPVQAIRDSFKPSVRISGRVIRVRDGQDLGNFEFNPDVDLPIIQGTCAHDQAQECLYESLGDNARAIAAAVGGLVAAKLADNLTASDPNRLPDVTAGARCPDEGRLRSQEGKTSTYISFSNRTGQAIRTYWLNYQGQRQYYAEIQDGATYRQQTYLTHPWVITDSRDNCLRVLMPTAQETTHSIF